MRILRANMSNPIKRSHKSVSVPREIHDDIEQFIHEHRTELSKIGIKKISHVIERSWYHFKENFPLKERLKEKLEKAES